MFFSDLKNPNRNKPRLHPEGVDPSSHIQAQLPWLCFQPSVHGQNPAPLWAPQKSENLYMLKLWFRVSSAPGCAGFCSSNCIVLMKQRKITPSPTTFMKTQPKMRFLTKILGTKNFQIYRFLQNHGSLTDKFTPDKNDGTGTRFSFPLG